MPVIKVNDDGFVTEIDYMMPEENIKEGHIVYNGQIPNAEQITGKSAQMKFDYSTEKIYFEYHDRPLTQEEQLKKMKDEQVLMQQALDDLIFGGAF